jgi:hypothetical protein
MHHDLLLSSRVEALVCSLHLANQVEHMATFRELLQSGDSATKQAVADLFTVGLPFIFSSAASSTLLTPDTHLQPLKACPECWRQTMPLLEATARDWAEPFAVRASALTALSVIVPVGEEGTAVDENERHIHRVLDLLT